MILAGYVLVLDGGVKHPVATSRVLPVGRSSAFEDVTGVELLDFCHDIRSAERHLVPGFS